MTTDQIVLLALSLLSTTIISVVGFFIRGTLVDFKNALVELRRDMNDITSWRDQHQIHNKTNFRSLRDEIYKCQNNIKRIKTRLAVLEADDGDE